jgi:secondary thiamine-phosphate synthase enzyme
MKVVSKNIELSTQGNCDIIDITADVQAALGKSGLKSGIANICAIGSTAGITTCEYEDGLIEDLKELFDKIIPQGKNYHHDRAWHDGNGHAHLRASLLGPSLTLSFHSGKLTLGTWQQIIFIDFDNRSRRRNISLQFIGE